MSWIPRLNLLNSIKNKLIFIYTVAVFFILLVLALLLYWFNLNTLYQADYQFLADELTTLQYILQNRPFDQNLLSKEIYNLPKTTQQSFYRYYVRIQNSKRTIHIETPGMQDILPLTTRSATYDLLNQKRYFWHYYHNKQYLVLRARVRAVMPIQSVIIEIALDIGYQHQMLTQPRKFAWYLLLLCLVALGFGIVIAKRGMKSLYLLTQTMETMTTNSLNQRIDPGTWPIELRGLANSFNDMLQRMQSSFDRLQQFSADLSHELRTPMHNLIAQTEVALTTENSVAGFKNVLEANLEEQQRMVDMIENILYLAKVENPALHLTKQAINLNIEIAGIVEIYQAVIDDKAMQINISGDSKIMANLDMFRRLIHNLLSNALRYSPPQSTVAITISNHTNNVSIVISDQGYGIEAHHLPVIFNRFYRTDAARLHVAGGIGLGLPIAKSIVELHGGSIMIESEINVGTQIHILWPK